MSRRRHKKQVELQGPAPEAVESPIFRTVAKAAVPITVVMSLVVFMQGHNFPGGGFIAGVLAAAAGAMHLLAYGTAKARNLPWWKFAVLGLLTSVLTGTVPLLMGKPFMDHSILHFHLPVVGEYELPTATFFDLGVYFIVLGTLMTIFLELDMEAA